MNMDMAPFPVEFYCKNCSIFFSEILNTCIIESSGEIKLIVENFNKSKKFKHFKTY